MHHRSKHYKTISVHPHFSNAFSNGTQEGGGRGCTLVWENSNVQTKQTTFQVIDRCGSLIKFCRKLILCHFLLPSMFCIVPCAHAFKLDIKHSKAFRFVFEYASSRPSSPILYLQLSAAVHIHSLGLECVHACKGGVRFCWQSAQWMI